MENVSNVPLSMFSTVMLPLLKRVACYSCEETTDDIYGIDMPEA
jgi:hypothetical protein